MASDKVENAGFLSQVLKGLGIAVIFILTAVLVLAALIKFTALSDVIIMPVNQFVKTVAVFLGCFFALKGSFGYVKGGLIGVLTILVSFLIFSLLSGEFGFSTGILWDLLFGLAVGVISGIIAVNIKKNS